MNTEERRLRAFFRLAIHFVAYSFLRVLFVTLVVSLWISFGPGSLGGDTAEASETVTFFFGTIGSLVGITLSVWLAGRFLDRRKFRDFGLSLDRGWWLDLCFGLLLGAALMTGIFLAQLSLGWVEVTATFDSGFSGVPFVLGILPPLLVFLCVGFYEELVSRGYQMKNLAEGLNMPRLGGPKGAILIAWLLTSMVFGLLHFANPNSTYVTTLNIMLAGILLGIGYVLTGQLAIPIGLHIAWNFFQGSVYGFPVSGLTIPGGSFIRIDQSGPELWTGGVFGPEAGLFDPIAVLVGSVLIFAWVRSRNGEAGIHKGLALALGRSDSTGSRTGTA